MSPVKKIRRRDPKRANRSAKIAESRRQLRVKAGIGPEDRLGYRLQEFAAAIGISMPTLWRRVRAGQINVKEVAGIQLVTMSEAARLGLIEQSPSPAL